MGLIWGILSRRYSKSGNYRITGIRINLISMYELSHLTSSHISQNKPSFLIRIQKKKTVMV